ncbi:MAG TPA: hypothetical protein VFV40_10380 [Nocardioides sp.]|nr:hypothetical protein [Nocardioides sp.]
MNPNSTVRTDIGWNRPTPTPRNGLLVAVLALTLGLGVLAVGGGLLFVVDDLVDTSEEFHGLGILIGAVIGVPGLVMAALSGIALSYRRSAPRRTRILGLALGAVLLLGMLLVSVVGTIGSVPVAFLGLALLVTAWFAEDDRQ